MIFPALTGRCLGSPRRLRCRLVIVVSCVSGGGGVGSGEDGTDDNEEEELEADEAAERKGVELE
jgi:hypothetical protein